MLSRLEITLKPDLFDAEGKKLQQRAKKYFNIDISNIRTIKIITIDADLTQDQLSIIQREVFTNKVVELSSFTPLDINFDWRIWVGYRPGVKDNAGSTAVEVIEDILGIKLKKSEAVYTSKRFCLEGEELLYDDINKIAGELIANDIIQQWKIYDKKNWDKNKGIGFIVPKVILNHLPQASKISIDSNETLKKISDQRNLALNPNDIPVIREYFQRADVIKSRAKVGLSEPTDIEIEYISQGRSDHCNHNTFQGLFHYTDLSTGETVVEIIFLRLIFKNQPWS